MIQTIDAVSLDAFIALLGSPDPTDLPRRAHVLRYEGEPNRRATRLQPILMGWLQRHFLEVDVEEVPAAARRTWKRRGRPVKGFLESFPRKKCMKSSIIAAAVSLCVVSLAAIAGADTLILSNGTRVNGTVVKMTGRTITFKDDAGMTRQYDANQVDSLRFLSVSTADLQENSRTGIGNNKRTAESVGGGAALGTLIGAVAGGAKGAAIGVLVGAAGGAGVQVLNKGKDLRVPADTVLGFRLDKAVSLHADR